MRFAKTRALITLLITILWCLVPVRSVLGASQCKDILILFARGSGQSDIPVTDPDFNVDNNKTKEAAIFFNEIDSRIASWIGREKINLADFTGKYNSQGYTATSAFNFESISEGDIPNAAKEKLGIEGNEYITSVNNGAQELSGFLEDRVVECPKQQIVLGGYSQGAQVVGQALNKLSNNALNKINYVALFGDPKLNVGFDIPDYQGALIDTSAKTIDEILETVGQGSNFEQPKAPWVRGDVDWKSVGGGFGPRSPYIPDQLSGRVGSWCDALDAICNGDLSKVISTHSGHTSYPSKWMGQAANEVADHLNNAFPAYTGAIKTAIWQPEASKNGKLDMMLVIDTTYSMASIINQVKANAAAYVNLMFNHNSDKDPRFGLVEFRDHSDSSFTAKTIQDLTSDKQKVISAIENLDAAEGGDDPEAWYSGIMQGYNQPWRNGARKIVYFVADSYPHDPEPNGLTAKDVIQKGLEIDPVQIYPIWVSGYVGTVAQPTYIQASNYLAEMTGGRVIKNPIYLPKYTNSYVTNSLLYSSEQIANDPVAIIDGPDEAVVGELISFNSNKSYDYKNNIIEYSWDLNNDNRIDVKTSSPKIFWKYDEPYNGFITLYLKTNKGGVSSATKTITIKHAVPDEQKESTDENNIDQNIEPENSNKEISNADSNADDLILSTTLPVDTASNYSVATNAAEPKNSENEESKVAGVQDTLGSDNDNTQQTQNNPNNNSSPSLWFIVPVAILCIVTGWGLISSRKSKVKNY